MQPSLCKKENIDIRMSKKSLEIVKLTKQRANILEPNVNTRQISYTFIFYKSFILRVVMSLSYYWYWLTDSNLTIITSNKT